MQFSSPDPAYFRLYAGNSSFLPHPSEDIELIESEEVPVVRKQARVVEEVNMRKIATEHTAAIRESLQHTELAVETLDSNADGHTVDLPPRPPS